MTSILVLALPVLCLFASIAFCVIEIHNIGIITKFFNIKYSKKIKVKKIEEKIYAGAVIKKIRNWLLYTFFINAIPLLTIVVNRRGKKCETGTEEIMPDVFKYVLVIYSISIMNDFFAIYSKSYKFNEIFSRMIPTVALLVIVLLYGDAYLKLYKYLQFICLFIFTLLIIYVAFRFTVNVRLWRKKKEEKVTIIK